MRDAGGYRATSADFTYAKVDSTDIKAMQAQEKPLGFESREQYDRCRSELQDALQQSGLNDADVRLKGSSGSFFSSNPDKVFPKSEETLVAQAYDAKAAPSDVIAEWRASPYAERDGDDLPNQHFWDSRHSLGLDSARSDYDIQVSSKALAEHMDTRYPENVDNRGRSIFSEHGGHYRDSIVRAEFSALDTWSKRWQGELGREVNLASFSDTGPAEEPAFKESDWIVRKPR